MCVCDTGDIWAYVWVLQFDMNHIIIYNPQFMGCSTATTDYVNVATQHEVSRNTLETVYIYPSKFGRNLNRSFPIAMSKIQ